MKKALLITIVFMAAQAVQALTDYGCVSRCENAGGSYGLCQARCTTEDAPVQQIKTTDYTCLNRCTAAGNMWQLCQDRCSY
jgi:hypothetical protein